MTSQTDERDFESTIESMLVKGGWHKGDVGEWDEERAVFPVGVVGFLRAAQPELWGQLAAQHGESLAEMVVDQLAKQLDIKGTLGVLRQGFKFQGKTLRMAFFKPANKLNPDAMAQFDLNELTVTRQVRCHPGKGDTIDLLFALNGVPVATCELKNPMTGQTWRNAIRQYKEDRDPNAPVFKFSKRALVHFAADTDEVHMATRLAKNKTRFLPFNRGSAPGDIRCGAGNPEHPSGYRSSYFWQEVLERNRFLDILGHYVFIEHRDEKIYGESGARTMRRETLVFPRYHQLDSVDSLVETARLEGAGNNYLIQHSAGSGKTNSISWLSHRLASLHTDTDDKVFDCVLVITDRRILDRQLQDAIYQIEHAQGVVQAIDEDSKQLAQALVDGTKIVITTLQKFPFVMQGLLSIAGAGSPEELNRDEQFQAEEWRQNIAGRRYAVIVDEAHSSQTGESARNMKAVLGKRSRAALESVEDWEDGLNAVVESRGPQPNLSFFAFTATPKGKTIELFGRHGASGNPEAFHVYSMRQAIEEGFILDVLRNYTDYDTYYRIVSSAPDDPEYPVRRAARILNRYALTHPETLAQKTEVIIEHFRANVRHRMNGKAKAMVVTSSRLHAVRYMRAFEECIGQKGYTDIRPLVAFSGTVTDPDTGEDFTESGMNTDVVSGKPISESALPARFDSPDYQILLVAEKYQTGFDQPLLQAMYVDKRLDGVQAVQTLSRLNRVAPGKSDPFVLDFVNDPEDIGAAFAPYYDQTQLETQSDPILLDGLKYELDEMQVYHHDEVERFAQVYFQPFDKRQDGDHARLVLELQPAVGRFRHLEEDEQARFRDRLGAFVRLYAFISQIIPYADSDLEQLAAFAKRLLPSLRDDMMEQLRLEDEVELEYYRLQHVSTGAIDLDDEGTTVRSPIEVGTGRTEEDEAPLSEIIANLNDRFGTAFDDSDRLFFEQIQEDGVNNENISQTAEANPFEKFELAMRQELPKLMIERMADNDEIVKRCLNDPDFREIVFAGLARGIYETVTAQ
ncbi:type I restriction endonuclease subunit R [Candidatus Poriferisocius sp.]|uniref:type I restriction endonuclease subunit R n=1 Tax=Candidatus Poriferisocius sp. TaxID=3101276 RepID=UPI003B011177